MQSVRIRSLDYWRPEGWETPGYHIVCENRNGNYLVTDPNWLANVIDLAAGLRLRGAAVALGYCDQQLLIASIAKVNAIASGTWMNARSFPPEKFQAVCSAAQRHLQ